MVFAGVLMGRALTARTASTTGTNSVDVAAVVAHAEPGQRACLRDLVLPASTAQAEVWMGLVDVRPNARITAWIRTADGKRIPLTYRGTDAVGDFKPFALGRVQPRRLSGVELCITAHNEAINFGGASVMRLPGAPVSTIAGSPLAGVDVSVRFERRVGDSPRVVDALGAAFSRASLFGPGIATIAIWLAFPLFFVLLYLVLRVAAQADAYSTRKLAMGAAGIALAHSFLWIVLLQPFHGADESEHFAYVQHLAATGHRPNESQTSGGNPYSSSELLLMEAVHHNSTILNSSSRLRWDRYYREQYRRALASDPSDADGGGYNESATGHSPFYYGIVGVPYRLLGRPVDLRTALFATRLFNAILASLVAALAVLTALTVMPGRKGAAWLAGLLVGLQPVFASVSATVNNDTGVNVLAALMVWLLARAVRSDGPRPRDAIAIGVVAMLLPVAKITGFALLPVMAVVVILIGLRHGALQSLRWLGRVAVGAAIAFALWAFVVSPIMGGGRGHIYNVHPVAGPAADATMMASNPGSAISPVVGGPAPLSVSPLGRAEYLLQTFIPQLPLGPRRWQLSGSSRLQRWPAFVIYVDRGYGLFGWRSTSLSLGLLKGILLALCLGWGLAVVAAVRARRRWRTWGGGVVVLAAVLLSVVAFISYAYATPAVHTEPGEQGRYIFTAIVPLAVLMSAAVLAAKRRLGALLLGAACAGTPVLAMLAWTSALRGWYM